MLAEDRPTIRAEIPPHGSSKRTILNAFGFVEAFATQLEILLAVLSPLSPESWARAATSVTGAGKALERTVRFYAQWLARHEQAHIKQIGRIVNTVQASARSGA